VQRTDLFRTTIFRSAALASAIFGATTIALLSVIYWQIEAFQSSRIERGLRNEVEVMRREPPGLVGGLIATRYARDIVRPVAAGLFDPHLIFLGGTLTAYPQDLLLNGKPQRVLARIENLTGRSTEPVRAIATRLPDGRVLVFGRSEIEIETLRRVVLRAMALGVMPSLIAGLVVGALASRRTLIRLERVSHTIERIIEGDLHERLETGGTRDAFDQLSGAVNRMLDELERLMEEIRTAGDAMAHDLRTPLARVRAQLEGARNRATTLDGLATAVDRAITELDSSFSIITALLRIAQFDGSPHQGGFAPVSLADITTEAVELYEPIAEAREITLINEVPKRIVTIGDRDLLFEVVMNLLDNAIKFSPASASVRLSAGLDDGRAWLAVQDHGPGIPDAERPLVVRRFQRGQASRDVPGLGLGLSLVAAILRLHRFHLHMQDAEPGLRIIVRCWPGPAQTGAGAPLAPSTLVGPALAAPGAVAVPAGG